MGVSLFTEISEVDKELEQFVTYDNEDKTKPKQQKPDLQQDITSKLQ